MNEIVLGIAVDVIKVEPIRSDYFIHLVTAAYLIGKHARECI